MSKYELIHGADTSHETAIDKLREASGRKTEYYVIRNARNAGLAWSNTTGWVEDESYDLFTRQETRVLQLPIEGVWWRVT